MTVYYNIKHDEIWVRSTHTMWTVMYHGEMEAIVTALADSIVDWHNWIFLGEL